MERNSNEDLEDSEDDDDFGDLERIEEDKDQDNEYTIDRIGDSQLQNKSANQTYDSGDDFARI